MDQAAHGALDDFLRGALHQELNELARLGQRLEQLEHRLETVADDPATSRHREIRALFLEGKSVSTIAAETGAARTTVLRHTTDLPRPENVVGRDGRSYHHHRRNGANGNGRG